MRIKAFLLLSLLATAGCAGSRDDLQLAGPVAPPAKPLAHAVVQTVSYASDFLAASGTNTVFFDTDKAVLTPQARDVLGRQADWLVTHAEVSFRVEGHCDERATNDYNRDLGRRRAEAVKAFFVDRGIRESRINAISFGESSPVIDKNGDIQINRRVVTVLDV